MIVALIIALAASIAINVALVRDLRGHKGEEQ